MNLDGDNATANVNILTRLRREAGPMWSNGATARSR
jgi:hypothetical protein